MARRVVLGQLGTVSGTAKYGLRISRPSNDACPSDTASAPVAIDQLRFDSQSQVIGHAPIYKIYDVTVSAATIVSGTGDLRHNPGTYTNASAFGETLSYVPIPVLFYVDGSTLKGDYWKIHDSTVFDSYAVNNKQLGADEGYEADVTKTGFTVYNWNTSQRTFRLFLLDASAVS